jgi:hypothetical protein
MRTCHTSPPDEARFPPHWRGAGAHCTGRYAGEKNFVDFDGDHNSRRPKFFHVRTAAGRAGRAGGPGGPAPRTHANTAAGGRHLSCGASADTCRATYNSGGVRASTPEASGLPLAQPLARDSMGLRPHAQRSPPPHRAALRTGPFAVWCGLFDCLSVWVCLSCIVLCWFVCVCLLFVVCVCLFVCCLRLVRRSCCKLRGRLRVTARCVCRTRPRSFC